MSAIRSVDGRWGKIYYIGKDEYVGRSLHNYGEYNPDETEKILELASSAKVEGGICLDIGANHGVMGQALEGFGHTVHSFEPQLDIFEHILLKNVRGPCYNVGLGESCGTAFMPRISFGDKCNYGGLGIGERSSLGQVPVRVETLDSFGFDKVYFMKIDVEGFEEQVLRGGVETIKRCRPVMYIEDDRAGKSPSLRAFIRSLNYDIVEHKPTLYRENNWFGLRKNVWERNYASHNIICTPC